MSSLMTILKRKQATGLEEEEAEDEEEVNMVSTPLSPLMEGPIPQGFDSVGIMRRAHGRWGWLRLGQLLGSSQSNKPAYLSPSSRGLSISSRGALSIRAAATDRSDLCLLLGVLGAPLAPMPASSSHPIPLLSFKTISMSTSSAQYIIQQYICATGVGKLGGIGNSYATGRVKMLASEFEAAAHGAKARSSWRAAESGCFVLWQMAPNMWNVEMAVGGSKVVAGSDGRLVWRHTPWLGSHAAKGPVRPLRRALQGLDPRLIATVFSRARCIGEKKVRGEDCFILKLSADAATLSSRSEGPAEIIRHTMSGYFSQKTGLLVQLEDSHLTKIQVTFTEEPVFWETNIDTSVEEYMAVDGVSVAHSGRTNAILFRFGEAAMNHTKTRLEEEWIIDEVAFGVPGLSADLFIPPADIVRIDPCAGSSNRGLPQAPIRNKSTDERVAQGPMRNKSTNERVVDSGVGRLRNARRACGTGPGPPDERWGACVNGPNTSNEGPACGGGGGHIGRAMACVEECEATDGLKKSDERWGCGNQTAIVATNRKSMGVGHYESHTCNGNLTCGGERRHTLGSALLYNERRICGCARERSNLESSYNEIPTLEKAGNRWEAKAVGNGLHNIVWRVEV